MFLPDVRSSHLFLICALLCSLVSGAIIFLTKPGAAPTENRALNTPAAPNNEPFIDTTPLLTPPPHSLNKPVTLLFDLNGVLFTISRKKAIDCLSFFDVLSYTLTGRKVEDLEDIIFDILNKIDAHDGHETEHRNNPDMLWPMHSGKRLPHIMCEWMRGTVTSEQIMNRVLAHVEQLYKENYFSCKAERNLARSIINIMFDPQTRKKIYKPLKKGVAIVQECKAQGHKLFLVSNMDADLIPMLQEQYPEIFALFDGMVVSANVGMIKPDANIYEHVLKTFKLKPHDCYFIDDQHENILGAQRLGIKGIHHNQRKTKRTRRKLIKWGILPVPECTDVLAVQQV